MNAPQAGRRCSMGCASWPDHKDFYVCPSCGEPTTKYSNLYPLDLDEALSRKRHIDFEYFYENDWPAQRPLFEARHPELAVDL